MGDSYRPRGRVGANAASGYGKQIVLVGVLDLDGHDIARGELFARADMNETVDLRRIAAGPPLGAAVIGLVDDDFEAPADLRFQLVCRNLFLLFHEAAVTLELHLFRNRSGEVVRRGA